LYGRILLLAGAVVAAVTAGIERWPRWGKEGRKEVSGRVGRLCRDWLCAVFKNIYFTFNNQLVAMIIVFRLSLFW